MGDKILVELKRDSATTKQDFLKLLLKYLGQLTVIISFGITVGIIYCLGRILHYPIKWHVVFGLAIYPGAFLVLILLCYIEPVFRYFISKFIIQEPVKEYIPDAIKKIPFQKIPVYNKPKTKNIAIAPVVTPKRDTTPKPNVIVNKSVEKIEPVIKAIPKIDYVELTQKRMEIGLAGELFVIKIVTQELIRNGLHDLANKVEHISLTNDSLGYDIVSYDRNGKKIFIEVKSTTDNRQTPFYLTDTEFENLKLADNYFIYRVFDLNIQTGNANYQIIDCKSDFQNKYKFQPASYKVSPIPL